MVTRMATENERLVSIQEAADYLGVSYKTVYRWIKQHKLEAQRAGAQWRIHKSDLRRDIEPSEQNTVARRDQVDASSTDTSQE